VEINKFNIRVYGLLENDQDEVLLVNEQVKDFAFTKFPGGGLELGEGTIDGLKREFKEELGIDIAVQSHYYTTDFFQQSGFRANEQLISIYYQVTCLNPLSDIRLDKFEITNGNQKETLHFFWQPKNKLHIDMVTFPIDKHVVNLLKAGSS
jgi:8-oxo-dGTP diphosphatase